MFPQSRKRKKESEVGFVRKPVCACVRRRERERERERKQKARELVGRCFPVAVCSSTSRVTEERLPLYSSGPTVASSRGCSSILTIENNLLISTKYRNIFPVPLRSSPSNKKALQRKITCLLLLITAETDKDQSFNHYRR